MFPFLHHQLFEPVGDNDSNMFNKSDITTNQQQIELN